MIFNSYGTMARHNDIIDLIRRVGKEFVDMGHCDEVLVRITGPLDDDLVVTLYTVNRHTKSFYINKEAIIGKPMTEVVIFIRESYAKALLGHILPLPVRSAKGVFE